MTMNEPGDKSAARRSMSIVQHKMAETMVQLLECAVESYRCIATLCPKPASAAEREIKEFIAHHAACRSALAHIDRLIRIQKWAASPPEVEGNVSDSVALLTHARSILEDYPPEDE